MNGKQWLRPSRRLEGGFTLIEALVTILIVSLGLLGLAGLQVRMQTSELEAYQRSQALVLLNDLASRISANQGNAASYVTSTPIGVGTCTDPGSTAALALKDLKEWCDAVQGAGETMSTGSGTGSRVGALIGGRGCVKQLQAADSTSSAEYLVTVAWQGLVPLDAPPSAVDCGAGAFNAPSTSGSPCLNDRCRRVLTTVLRFARSNG